MARTVPGFFLRASRAKRNQNTEYRRWKVEEKPGNTPSAFSLVLNTDFTNRIYMICRIC